MNTKHSSLGALTRSVLTNGRLTDLLNVTNTVVRSVEITRGIWTILLLVVYWKVMILYNKCTRVFGFCSLLLIIDENIICNYC